MGWKAKLSLFNPRFALSSIASVVLGAAAAYYFHLSFNFLYFVLTFLVVVLFSYGAFAMNEYGGFLSGVDVQAAKTSRSGWSAGGNILARGLLSPSEVLRCALASFIIGGVLGIYLTYLTQLWLLIPIGLFAVGSGFFYEAPPLKLTYRFPGAHDILVPLNFVLLSTFVSYYVQSRELTLIPIVISIPATLASASLRILTSIPDREADEAGCRKTAVVFLGLRKSIDVVILLNTISLLTLLSLTFLNFTKPTALFSIPFALLALWRALKAREQPESLSCILSAIRSSALHGFVGTKLILALTYII